MADTPTSAETSANDYARKVTAQPIRNDADFAEAYKGLKANSAYFSEQAINGSSPQKSAIDQKFYGYLQTRFGNAADFKITPPNATKTVEVSMTERALAASDAPSEFNTREKLIAAGESGSLDRIGLQRFIAGVPSLRGFTTNDAVNLVRGGDHAAETASKFPNADSNILKATAYTALRLNRESLKESHPDFYEEHKNTDFKDRAHKEVFGVVRDDPAYKKWEGEKRQAIVDHITTDPALVADITRIKAPVNINTVQDVKTHLDVRERVADKIGDIYAQTYDLKTFGADDIHVVYTPSDEIDDNPSRAYAWSTIPGVNNDEAVIIRENPVRSLLTGKYNNPIGMNQAGDFLDTVTEEIQHTTDKIHADRVVNGEMQEDHPAYRHAALIALNNMNYASNEENLGNYNSQFTERTAKQVASDVSMNVTFTLGSAFDEAAESTQSAPTTEPKPAPPQPSAQSAPAPPAASGLKP